MFELRNVSLKLNEFGSSILTVVFGIKGKDGPSIVLQNLAELHFAVVLIRQCEINGFCSL
jgi:hypothetical protein